MLDLLDPGLPMTEYYQLKTNKDGGDGKNKMFTQAAISNAIPEGDCGE
jgi:hypothetical protein